MERKTMSRFRLGKLTPLAFFGSIAAYGIFAQVSDAGITSLWAVTIVVSMMHFWYDGFVWSVRRK
jgi:hypothetical protein